LSRNSDCPHTTYVSVPFSISSLLAFLTESIFFIFLTSLVILLPVFYNSSFPAGSWTGWFRQRQGIRMWYLAVQKR